MSNPFVFKRPRVEEHAVAELVEEAVVEEAVEEEQPLGDAAEAVKQAIYKHRISKKCGVFLLILNRPTAYISLKESRIQPLRKLRMKQQMSTRSDNDTKKQKKNKPKSSKLTERMVLKAIQGSGGIVLRIAQTLGVEWHTANTFIENNTNCKNAVEWEKETMLDLCEDTLYDLIQEKNENIIKFYLERKGRQRGYSPVQENAQPVHLIFDQSLTSPPPQKQD